MDAPVIGYALEDLDQSLIRGSSLERWLDFLVQVGMGPYDGQVTESRAFHRLHQLDDARRWGHLDHAELVASVALPYAAAVKGHGPWFLGLAADHWEESSRRYEPYQHLVIEPDHTPSIYHKLFDPRMPKSRWFTRRLTSKLVDAGIQQVLVTGSPDLVAGLYAKRFGAIVGASLVLEIETESRHDSFTGRVLQNGGLVEEKERAAQRYAELGPIILAVGDRTTDFPLLERAAIKVIVGNNIDPPDHWTGVVRLPNHPTIEGRRQLDNLLQMIDAQRLQLQPTRELV